MIAWYTRQLIVYGIALPIALILLIKLWAVI